MKTAVEKTSRIAKKNGQVDINTPAADVLIERTKAVQLETRIIKLKIVGTSPLVVHAWSEKAKRMMLEKQMGIASAGKEKKNPMEDFKSSLYRLPGNKGFCIPACSLKNAAVTAANMMELKMTDMRKAFHVMDDYLPIIAPAVDPNNYTPEDMEYREQIKFEHQHGASMRSDMVRVGMGTADIRYRAQFTDWAVEFNVQYNKRAITVAQLVTLFNNAGFGVGIFEYRPEKNGSWGRFEIAGSVPAAV